MKATMKQTPEPTISASCQTIAALGALDNDVSTLFDAIEALGRAATPYMLPPAEAGSDKVSSDRPVTSEVLYRIERVRDAIAFATETVSEYTRRMV